MKLANNLKFNFFDLIMKRIRLKSSQEREGRCTVVSFLDLFTLLGVISFNSLSLIGGLLLSKLLLEWVWREPFKVDHVVQDAAQHNLLTDLAVRYTRVDLELLVPGLRRCELLVGVVVHNRKLIIGGGVLEVCRVLVHQAQA